jgi:predicted porin
MQKKLIALAVAALASGAAFAQSNVTIYGTVDVGFAHRGDNITKGVNSQNAINSGQSSDSLIGFKGVEDLGNGNKALFVLEAGFHADDGNQNNGGQLFDEQAFLGLTGNWGTAIAGRLVAPRYGFLVALDPFGAGTVASYRNVFNDIGAFGVRLADVDRVDNAVAYVSPTFSGFNVTAAYSTNAIGQEVLDKDGEARTIALLPRYTNGPLDIGVSYQRVKVDAGAPIPVDLKSTNTTIGASYDFGVVKLSAFYDKWKEKETFDTTLKTWLVGASVPFGKHAIQVSYTQSKLDGDDGKAKQWGLGYTYSLSKRTNFYAAYADINNDDGRGTSVGDATNNGQDYQNGLQFGLKHTF